MRIDSNNVFRLSKNIVMDIEKIIIKHLNDPGFEDINVAASVEVGLLELLVLNLIRFHQDPLNDVEIFCNELKRVVKTSALERGMQ